MRLPPPLEVAKSTKPIEVSPSERVHSSPELTADAKTGNVSLTLSGADLAEAVKTATAHDTQETPVMPVVVSVAGTDGEGQKR